jgi:hypothetical protein
VINLSAWDKYDDDAMGGVEFTLDMMNPFTLPSAYKFVQDPNSLTAVQMAYWPTITAGGGYLASYLAGGGNPYKLSYTKYLLADKYRMMANYMKGPHPVLKAAAPTVAVTVGWTELHSTATGNVGMEPVPHVPGAYTNPMSGGGSDTFYYPGKGIIDWLFG